MKQKIFGSLIVLAIATVAAFNVNLNLAQESSMSALALANVEALAGENGGQGIFKCEPGYNKLIYTDIQFCNGTYGPKTYQETEVYTCSATTEVYGSCKIGQIHTYYVCDMVHSRHDFTSTKSCSLF
ncbi:NVEALA domain-containing protein [Dysgonomonas reticulitermitis]